jgi:hypothetical protein
MPTSAWHVCFIQFLSSLSSDVPTSSGERAYAASETNPVLVIEIKISLYGEAPSGLVYR